MDNSLLSSGYNLFSYQMRRVTWSSFLALKFYSAKRHSLSGCAWMQQLNHFVQMRTKWICGFFLRKELIPTDHWEADHYCPLKKNKEEAEREKEDQQITGEKFEVHFSPQKKQRVLPGCLDKVLRTANVAGSRWCWWWGFCYLIAFFL